LELAGFDDESVNLFRKLPMEYDFYLAHQMDDTRYVREWRLYVPK
jgi:hypothetical protein